MPSGRSVMLSQLVRTYHQLVAKTKLQKEYGLPLVEFGIELRNRSGERRELFGLVPEGVGRDKAVKLVVEQNNGFCDIERGGYDPVNKTDLSEFTWIKQIALSDGFKVEDWLQIRNRHGEFEIGSAQGKSFWENANTKKVDRYDNRIMITEDYRMTAELPDTDKLINGKEKACGGCGGAVTSAELKLASGIANMKTERDAEYSINLDTGKIREKTPLKFMEFDYKQERFYAQEPPDFHKFNGNFNEAVREKQYFFDAGIFIENKKLRLHEFARYDAVYAAARALKDEDHTEIPAVHTITGQSETRFPQTNQAAAAPFRQEEFRQEESMIIRLLMNPVERKLWGKLYGLPDDEEIRKSNETCKQEFETGQIKKYAPVKAMKLPARKILNHKKHDEKEPEAKVPAPKMEIIKLQAVKQTLNTELAPFKIEKQKIRETPASAGKEIKLEKKQNNPQITKPKEMKKKKRRKKFMVKEIPEKKIALPRQKTMKIKTKKEMVDKKKETGKHKTDIKPGKENKKKKTKPEIPENKEKEKKKRADNPHASFSKKKKPVKSGKNIVNYLITEDIRHLFGKQPRKEVQQECN